MNFEGCLCSLRGSIKHLMTVRVYMVCERAHGLFSRRRLVPTRYWAHRRSKHYRFGSEDENWYLVGGSVVCYEFCVLLQAFVLQYAKGQDRL